MNKNDQIWKITKSEENLLNLITKYLVLLGLANTATFIMLGWWGMEVAINQLPALAQSFLAMDNFVNLLSLYLQYIFGNDLYHKLCTPCHVFVKVHVTRQTLSSLHAHRLTVSKTPSLVTMGSTSSASSNSPKSDIDV